MSSWLGGGSPPSSSSTRARSPSAAASHSCSMRAPRATRSRATAQQPYPIALASGVPIEPSGMSMSAPASMRAAATSSSSLLAAQCSGASLPLPGSRSFGFAPAAARIRTVCGPFGKYPGQLVTMCSGLRQPPLRPATRALSMPGCSLISLVSVATSPPWMASASSIASGSFSASVMGPWLSINPIMPLSGLGAPGWAREPGTRFRTVKGKISGSNDPNWPARSRRRPAQVRSIKGFYAYRPYRVSDSGNALIAPGAEGTYFACTYLA
jgi:hypothetical protein